MSTSASEHSSATTKTTQTSIEQSTDDLSNLVDGRNKPLVVILAVTLPTLAFIGIIILLITCYRRRHATLWLKKIEHSNRLQAIVVNLSSAATQLEFPEKKTRLSHRRFSQPRTETIIYNRLSTPPTPVFINSYTDLKSSTQGVTNAAFDEYLVKNEQQQQPVLRTKLLQSSTNGQRIASIHADFPVSLQAPVRTITSVLVDAIAIHRISLVIDANNTSSSLETTTTTTTTTTTHNHPHVHSRHSGTSSSYSNNSQTVLLFSQRTEL